MTDHRTVLLAMLFLATMSLASCGGGGGDTIADTPGPAPVPDQNGAGIRAEGNGLTIINAGFYDNENGILGPYAGDLTITRSEFARNGVADPAKVDGYGQTHNIYVGSANKVTVTSSFFHQANIGHNFKSRAKENRIEGSYFMDGPNGSASYQVDVPNGGIVYLRGNVMQKGPRADNSNLVSYGAEGLTSGVTHTLTMIHNTLVSTYSGGSFINANSGVASITLTANLFAGTNGPAKYNGGVSAKVTETNSIVSTASNLTAPDNIANPNFWPTPTLAGLTSLAGVPDATYLFDAPNPYVRRSINTAAPRRVGALQSAP